jgi:tetratricopeptide (TPR) repeat protein
MKNRITEGRHRGLSLRAVISLFLLGAILLLTFSAVADQKKQDGDPETLVAQANAAYLKGRYEQAATLYTAVVHEIGISAELLGNLADSYAAAGQIGLAVLNYERALLLAPGNADLRTSLAQLRKDAGLFRAKSLPEQLAELLGADQWLLISGTAFVLLALTVLVVGVIGRKRCPWARRLNFLFLTATLLPLPPALLRYQAWQNGVVTAPDARLLISPFAEAEAVGSVKTGSIIRPLHKEHGGYLLVRDENGRSGWIAQTSFQRIANIEQGRHNFAQATEIQKTQPDLPNARSESILHFNALEQSLVPRKIQHQNKEKI